jgi:hypothetical protein
VSNHDSASLAAEATEVVVFGWVSQFFDTNYQVLETEPGSNV